jgi:hypothetical protein
MRRPIASLLVVAAALASLGGCASMGERAPIPYIADPGDPAASAPWADLVEIEDGRRVEVSPAATTAVALVRADGGRLVNPGAADLEAIDPARGASASLGEPRPVTRGAVAARPRLTIADLRAAAARLGAPCLLVARFEGRGRERRLFATLHETATGREIARYGPSEPSLAIAVQAMREPGPSRAP